MTLLPVMVVAALAVGLHAGTGAGPTGVDSPERAAATLSSLTAAPSTGAPFQIVTIAVRVAPGTAGSVTIRDGAALLAADLPLVRGAASFTTNALGAGPHDLTAELLGDAAVGRLAAAATYGAGAAAQATRPTVSVTIPRGALTLTRLPAGRAAERRAPGVVDVLVTDTRAGNLGFVVTVGAPPCAGALRVRAEPVEGNALRAQDVRLIDADLGVRAGAPRTVARYPAGLSTGAILLHGVLAAGSPAAGSCRLTRAAAATLTFTVM